MWRVLRLFVSVSFVWFVLVAMAQAQTPTINPLGLVNAATGRSSSSVPVAARGSIVSIFGKNFSTATASADRVPLPIQLPGTGTQVLFGGIAAPLFFVSPAQINAQVPFELPDVSSVDLVVRNEFGASAPLNVTLLAQDPGIFVVFRDRKSTRLNSSHSRASRMPSSA